MHSTISYLQFAGKLSLDENVEEGEISVKLPQIPMANEKEKFTLELQKPRGFNAKLDAANKCNVTVTNSLGW